MGYNIGPKIGIEGEKEFRDSISKINAAYKTLDAETRAVTAAFEAQGDEQGKLEATSKQLQKQIDNQKQKMALLEDAVKKASDKFGENSVEANRLRGVLFDTQATVSKLETELKDTESRIGTAGDAMEEFAADTGQAGAAALNFGDILKANVISEVIMDGLRELGSLTKDFALGSIEAAATVKAENSQMAQTFAELESVARQSLQAISDDTDIAVTRMQGGFTQIYAFAKTVGSDSAEALTVASRAMVAAADNAAYYDKSIEEATEQLQSFLKGNYANDAALGIAATETARNTKANELYAKSFAKLSESQKVDVLLAMVEAGNEASGALGQAARESDSWENVMGELAEAMRQIQAEAGKPALKALTPVIQRITDAAYELLEDTDWDAFGETVENIANSVIEYGPGIVKAIASITAGIVAMKATQKVGEFVALAQSLVGIGVASTTAGNAVAASGAVAMASPWGLVAAAIGAAVSLIVAAVTSTESEASKLDKAMERLDESMARANEQYEQTANEISGAAYAAERYLDRLEELESAGLESAAAQREYSLIVEELNDLVPELNLSIDEQTGLINENTDAVRMDVAAWKEAATAKALQEKFSDTLEARGRAQAELIDSQVRLNRLAEEELDLTAKRTEVTAALDAANDELIAAEAEYNRLLNTGSEEWLAASDRCDAARESITKLTAEQNTLNESLHENENEQKKLSKSIEDAEEKIASYDGAIQNAEASLKYLNETTKSGDDANKSYQLSAESVRTELSALAQAYADAKEESLESINSQIGLFEELTLKSDYSASKIIENWKNQQRAFIEYRDNLQKAVDMGLDQALVQQLSDGSQQSMMILDALVNDTKISIDEINAAFGTLSESKDALATTLGEMKVIASEEFSGIAALANASGVNVVDGLIAGVNSQSSEYQRTLAELARLGLNSFNQEMAINSPARKMIPSGEFTVEGAIVGVENRAKAFETAMADLALAGENAFLSSQLARVGEYPSVVQSPTMYSRSVSHNYGGQTFQIYQQPGESNEDLAYRIMEIIQQEVDAKEAGIGA